VIDKMGKGRGAKIGPDELSQIVRLAEAHDWTVKRNRASSYTLCPPDSSQTPVTVRQSRTGYYLTAAQLRQRGLEIDPNRLRDLPPGKGQRCVNQPGAQPKPKPSPKPTARAVDDDDRTWIDTTTDGDHRIRASKPLPEGYQVSAWAKSHAFNTHSLMRLAERNIHVWEAYAALDKPDYTKTREPDRVSYIRGDVLVGINPITRTIHTVIDISQRYRTVPRVMHVPDSPEVPVAERPNFSDSTTLSAAPSSEPAPIEVPAFMDENLPFYDRLRLYLAGQVDGSQVTAMQLIEVFGDEHKWRIYKQLVQLADDGKLTRTGRGEFRLPSAADLATESEPRRSGGAVTAAKRAANAPTARQLLLPILYGLTVRDRFTISDMAERIGEDKVTRGNLWVTMRTMISSGFLTQAGYRSNEQEYRLTAKLISREAFLADKNTFTVEDLIKATGLSQQGIHQDLAATEEWRRTSSISNRYVRISGLTTQDHFSDLARESELAPVESELVPVEPESALEPEPEPEPLAPEPEPEPLAPEPEPVPVEPEPALVVPEPSRVEWRAPTPAPRQEMPMLSTSDEGPTWVGFEFTPLPQSTVYQLAEEIRTNLDALTSHPGQWAQIAVFDRAAEDTARKTATALQEHLADPALEFIAAWTATAVGVFVRVRVPTPGRV
jgi:hypothetical protein